VPDAEVAGWLAAAAAHGWLAAGAVVVVERSARGAAFPWPLPLRARRERRYGETTLFLGELPGPGEAAVSVRE
jgi:16S rRNA (guanine966-N2)-methyltransferase